MSGRSAALLNVHGDAINANDPTGLIEPAPDPVCDPEDPDPFCDPYPPPLQPPHLRRQPQAATILNLLKQVYAATHPAAHLKPQSAAHAELLAPLDAEAQEEDA